MQVTIKPKKLQKVPIWPFKTSYVYEVQTEVKKLKTHKPEVQTTKQWLEKQPEGLL